MKKNQIQLADLAKKLKVQKNLKQKLKIIQSYSKNRSRQDFDVKNAEKIKTLPLTFQIIIASLFAIGQGNKIFEGITDFNKHQKKILHLLEELAPIEEFYAEMGGLIGYHSKFLELLMNKSQPAPTDLCLTRAPGIDLSQDTKETDLAIRDGIETLNELAELYPIAGAADRLDLKHPDTQEPLPAAKLNFLGMTLLEGMIRDIEAREYLHYKLTGRRIKIPVVLMTSHEKNNFIHVKNILKSSRWFHRQENSYFFIQQPKAPLIQTDGNWSRPAPLELAFKPGGHGALWKLMKDQGAFSWLQKRKKNKAIIRQINNPIAGTDGGLLALSGIGIAQNKVFGFASCERFIKSAEGIDVLIEKKLPEGIEYCLTNIEYTNLDECGIEDCAKDKKSPYSFFPANTNLLFANLKEIKKTIRAHPYPGLIINLKSKGTAKDASGACLPAGRLESMMQNIADKLTTLSPSPLTISQKKELPTFITYNARHKTLVSTKQCYHPESGLKDTPEGALQEILKCRMELLLLCGFKTPKLREGTQYLSQGPSFLFHYHPALGPLYKIISQKIRGGQLHEGAECNLEIANIFIQSLELKGSLLVSADQITGSLNPSNCRTYNDKTGKCILKNVRVENSGIDYKASTFWNNAIIRKESLEIHIEGNGEFLAENVTFKGNHRILVPNGFRVTAKQSGRRIELFKEKISKPSWKWSYRFNKQNEVILDF